MNQAMRRQLHSWLLLLLVPLLTASAPPALQAPVFPPPGPAVRFELDVPPTARAGDVVRLTVTAFDANGNMTGDFIGPIQFISPTLNIVPPLNPSFELTDRGVKTFEVRFRTASLQPQKISVNAVLNTNITSQFQDILVAPGVATSFEILSRTTTEAAELFYVGVRGVDAEGNQFTYPGNLVFSSNDDLAFLPGTVSGTQPSFPIALKTAGSRTLTVTAENDRTVTGTVTIEVTHTDFHRVAMTTLTAQPVATCTPAIVKLQAVDRYDNAVPEAKEVELCGTPSHALEPAGDTLFDKVPASGSGCIKGKLSSRGEAQVSWRNMKPDSVAFTVTYAIGSPTTITWQAGSISPDHSELSLPGAGTPPLLRIVTGEQRVVFELRNACNAPVDPPAGLTLGFETQAPLVASTPAVREELGRWSTTVRLPRCPDTGTASLKLRPTLNGEPILRAGVALYSEITPNCMPPDVQLTLESRPKDAEAIPGAEVEFDVTVSNTGNKTIPEGLLWVDTQALGALEASLDKAPFVAVDGKLTLPALEPGAARSVKIQAQAAVQMDQTVKLTARYTTVAGDALTEEKQLSLEWGELEVDVGHGCQTVPLASQFLPWLALLVAASRARARLRRLTRGERNDR